jgi:hypothetical protein
VSGTSLALLCDSRLTLAFTTKMTETWKCRYPSLPSRTRLRVPGHARMVFRLVEESCGRVT